MRVLTTDTAYLVIRSYFRDPKTGHVEEGNKQVTKIPHSVDLYLWLEMYSKQNPQFQLTNKVCRELDMKRESEKIMDNVLLFEYEVMENSVKSVYDKDVPKHLRPKKHKLNFNK